VTILVSREPSNRCKTPSAVQVGNTNPGPVEHSPGGPRLTAKGKATRQRIIAAASEGFSERGVTATSNDDILAVAGASHSQLYHYFTDRDDLVVAVIADRVEQVLSHQESLLAGSRPATRGQQGARRVRQLAPRRGSRSWRGAGKPRFSNRALL
jgi:AcrR family transcriptional regulator